MWNGKRKLLVMCMMGLLLGISGCTRRDSEPTDPTSTVTPTEESGQLQMWVTDHKEHWQNVGRLWTAELGRDQQVRVTLEVVEFATEEELQQALLRSQAAGYAPDVVITNSDWVSRHAEQLTPVVEGVALPLSQYDAQYVRATRGHLVQGETLYGVPVSVDTLGVVYNDDHIVSRLADANVPGATWGQFRKEVEMLTRTDNSFDRFEVSGTALGTVQSVPHAVEIVWNIMHQMGTEFFTPDGTQARFASTRASTGEGRQNFGLEALEFFLSFANPQYKNYSWSDVRLPEGTVAGLVTMLLEEEVSMIILKASDLQELERQIAASGTVASNWRSVPLPQFQDPSQSNSLTVLAEVQALVVPRLAANPSWGWQFLLYATQQSQAQAFTEATMIPSALVSQIAPFENDPLLGAYARQAKYAETIDWPVDRAGTRVAFARVLSGAGGSLTKVGQAMTELEAAVTTQLRAQVERTRWLEKIRRSEVEPEAE